MAFCTWKDSMLIMPEHIKWTFYTYWPHTNLGCRKMKFICKQNVDAVLPFWTSLLVQKSKIISVFCTQYIASLHAYSCLFWWNCVGDVLCKVWVIEQSVKFWVMIKCFICISALLVKYKVVSTFRTFPFSRNIA